MGTKIPETITKEEIDKILQATKKPKQQLAYALGFYQAMRVSEVVKLQPENIDRGQKLIRIKQAKGGKDRNIPIMPEVLRGLKHLPIGRGIRALEISFKKKAKEVLNKDLHFHTLRHSGATYLLSKKKWDIRHIQVFLGHAKLSSTEIYTKVSPQDLLELVWGKE